jgi:hypothetical protein
MRIHNPLRVENPVRVGNKPQTFRQEWVSPRIKRFRDLWDEIHDAECWTRWKLLTWIARVPNVSCGCRNWVLEYLERNPPRFDDLYEWSVEFHDAVSAKVYPDRPPWDRKT